MIILLTIIVLFFGAKRIPVVARSLGKGAREFRKGASEDTEPLRKNSELPGDERTAISENVQVEQKATS